MQPVLGDMLPDLPEVSSFNFSERAQYRTAPQTPFQQFLRRPPPFHESSQEARAAAADRFMQGCREAWKKKICEGRFAFGGVEKVMSYNPITQQ